MKFDEDLELYVFETDGLTFGWEEEPEGDYESGANVVARKYRENLPGIIAFMLPDLREMYGDVAESDVEEKLGTPLIMPAAEGAGGVVTYVEQTFDEVHIFTFEYLDDEFCDLQYFCVDG